MGIPAEYIAPITVDLRAVDYTFNIIKGIEFLKYVDIKMDTPAQVINPGLWVMTTSTGCVLPTSTGLSNVYPVVVGNNEYDSIANGQVTVLVGGGFLVQTTQFASTIGSYALGDPLTVNTTTGLLAEASSSNVVVAKVFAINSTAKTPYLTVEVLASAYVHA